MFNFLELKAKLEELQVLTVSGFQWTKDGLQWLYNRIGQVRTELLAAIGAAKSDAIAGAKTYTDTTVDSAKTDVKSYADGKAATAKSEAIADAKTYTDQTVDSAKTDVKSYADGKAATAKSEAIADAKTYTDQTAVTTLTAAAAAADQKVAAEVIARDQAIAASKTLLESYADSKATAAVATAKAYTDGVGDAAEQARAAMQTTLNNRLTILESGNFGAWEDFAVLPLTAADGIATPAQLADVFAASMTADGKTVKPNATYVLMVEGNVEVEKSIIYTKTNGQSATANASAGEQFVVKTDANGVVVSARYVANPFMEAKMATDANFQEVKTGIADLKNAVATNNANILAIRDGIQAMVQGWTGGLPNS
jgi:hypothetical protein